MAPSKPDLQEIVRRIVDGVHPLRILLFGSAVRGETGPDSDIDVMVVMPEGTHRRHTSQDIYQLLVGLHTPIDVVVATPSDLEKHRDTIGLVYRSALRDGKEIYAAG